MTPEEIPHDLVRCEDCSELQKGRCAAAFRGELVEIMPDRKRIAYKRRYAPHPSVLRRCASYLPYSI